MSAPTPGPVMDRRTKAATCLAVLVALLVVGTVLGVKLLTAPFSTDLGTSLTTATCTPREVQRGAKVYTDEVLVSVFNAGSKPGLAGNVLEQLAGRGFAEGDQGNAPAGTRVRRAEIWTDTPDSPAVRLVRAHLGGDVRVVEGERLAAGIVVVVGNDFGRLAPAQRFATARADAEICGP